MITLAQIVLFLLVVTQVFFLFRVDQFLRRWLRLLIPKQRGVLREFVAALLFLSLVALEFGVYLVGLDYLVMLALASAFSIPPAELRRSVPMFWFIGLFMLGVCVKLWPRHFAFCGLTTRTQRTP